MIALCAGVAIPPVAVALPLGDQFALPKLASVLVASAALLVLVRPLTAARRLPPIPTGLIAIFVLAMCAATGMSEHPIGSVLGAYADYNGLLYYLPGAVFFLAALTLVRTVRSFELLVSALSIGAAPVLLYAILQIAHLDPIDWSTSFEGRVFSTFGQPLVLGGYCAVILPLLVWLALRRTGPERWLLGSEAAIALLVLAATETRGAALACGVSFVTLAVLHRRSITPRFNSPAVIALLGALSVTGVIAFAVLTSSAGPARLTSTTALEERVHLWRTSTEMITEQPVLGWGPDQFAVNYGRHRPSADRGTQSPYEEPPANPHNETLMVTAAGGLAGGVPYVALWLVVLIQVALTRGRGQRWMASTFVCAAAVAYLVQAQFSIPDPALFGLGMTVLGACAGLGSTRPRAVLTRLFRVGPLIRAGALSLAVGAVIAACSLVAADAIAGQEPDREQLRLAALLNPLQAAYLDQLGEQERIHASDTPPAINGYRDALDAYERRIVRFDGTVVTYLAAAETAALLTRYDKSYRDTMDLYIAGAREADPLVPGLDLAIARIELLAEPR